MIVRMSKVQAEAVSGLIEDWVDRDYSDEDWLWGFEGELEGGHFPWRGNRPPRRQGRQRGNVESVS